MFSPQHQTNLVVGVRAELSLKAYRISARLCLLTGDSKPPLGNKLNLRLSSRKLAYPSHRVLLSELRGFEYLGAVGASGRARTGASRRGHDDVVMSLALAVYAAPAAAPVALGSQILLGAALGGKLLVV